MITVVHLITKLELGGAQENTLYTCEHLDRSRFRVALLHGPGGVLDEDARSMPEVDVKVVPELVRQIDPRKDSACWAALFEQIYELRKEHERQGNDPRSFIVHTHSSKAGVIGRLSAKQAGAPILIHTIHGFGFHEGQSRLKQHLYVNAERLAAKVTNGFIGVSRSNLAEAKAKRIIGPKHTVRLIRSGMTLSVFREAEQRRTSIRASLGLKPDDEAILAIANFKPQKDPMTMICAMEQLVESRPHAILLFAGDGGMRHEIETAILRKDLSDHVRLLGWRRDIPDLLAACDIVALSSIFEGLPRSAVQALAARRPFVGTRVDGTSEIIRDGRNGYLVEPRSPERLASALARALISRPIDPEDEERIHEWDADHMVRQQEEMYAELADR